MELTPFDELKQRAAAEDAAYARPAAPDSETVAQPPEELSLAQKAGDVLLAPLRGLEGAVQGVYGLADTLVGDALPDYQQRLFGESRTGLGGLIEGMAQFGAGFVGAGFLPLEWAGELGSLAPVARGLVKGAAADFAVFNGHQRRLSNLIQEFPALQNPVSNFLAADPNDPELEGRMKNALEGLGVGSFTELALHGLRAMRAGLAAKSAGKDAEGVARAMDRAAPPDAADAAWRQATGQPPLPPPDGNNLGSPVLPEAADAASPPTPTVPAPPPAPASDQRSVDLLHSMDVAPEQARALMERVRQREAPIVAGPTDLYGAPPLDPRVNPRNMSEQERMAQGMLQTDLNLSRYQGPEGALQLMRAMEQVLEPLKGLGEASRRTLNQQEQTGLQELADMVGEGNPQRLLVALQQDVQTLPALNRRVIAYKTALQAYSDHTYRLASSAAGPLAGDASRVQFMDALRTLSDLELGVKSLLGEQGRGLGANRIPTRFVGDLFDKDAVEAALHEVGGRSRVDDLIAKFRLLYSSSADPVAQAAKSVDLARGVAGRRAFGVLNEYWYNSLLGRPTTIAVNALSNALTAVYRPLELIAGGALTGRSAVIQDGVREIGQLVQSAGDSWRATAAALRGEGQLLDPRTLVSDVQDLTQGNIGAAAFGVGKDTLHGQALDWLGRLVRMPSTVLTATDQFFQQLNYRAVARSQLIKEAAAQGLGAADSAKFVQSTMDALIYRGQAYGTAQLYGRGVEEAVRNGLRAKTAVDEYARDFAQRALGTPEHARLSALGDLAQRRAQEATFTTPLAPGTLPYRIQEAVQNHWYLRMVMPFVRTPVNIIGFAADRTVRGAWGAAQALAARQFPAIAGALENTRNTFVRDMLSGDSRASADATGRLALGMTTTAWILTKASEINDDGLPTVTGAGPADKDARKLLEGAGWQPYSIRVGDKYVAYGRVDPFAAILGTAADIVNYAKFAAPEDQGALENLVYGTAVALSSNLLNKTYLSGLANFVDMLHDPQTGFANWARTTAASFVPGQSAAAVAAADPLVRSVNSMLDAAKARVPGASATLPPMRNVLGEPVHRASALGGDVSSVANAFVPILYRSVSDDVVDKGLRQLGHGFTPPGRMRGALDLTTVTNADGQNAYDRWLELHGSVELGGRTLRQSLRRLMTSAAYERIPPQSTEDVASPRIALVQREIDRYRAAAYRQVLREYPELGDADRARYQSRLQLRRGVETRPALLQALQPQQ